jgi:hypothetical protein
MNDLDGCPGVADSTTGRAIRTRPEHDPGHDVVRSSTASPSPDDLAGRDMRV